MAIQLRNTASLNDEFDFVSEHDDALDKSDPEWEQKLERFRDGASTDLPLKDGKEPTVFRLKPIASNRTLSLLQDLLAREGGVTYFTQAAALGLVGAQNLGIEIKRQRIDKHEQVRDDVLSQIPIAILCELGKAVVEHSHPNPD